MNDLNDYIPVVGTMKTQTINIAYKRKKVELRSAIIRISDIIKNRAANGYGFVGPDNTDVKVIMEECPFITWSMVAKVFNAAGYNLLTEKSLIVWDDDTEMKG